ncbi:MAG TPA: hypothetical protein VFV37_10910 [Luteibaculaceae bacterium]|nr:hypothetical protein [Luteibaculaceae bacterium]
MSWGEVFKKDILFIDERVADPNNPDVGPNPFQTCGLCCYVLASVTSDDPLVNDQTSYLEFTPITLPTVIVLKKDGNFVANLNDNTYGTYFGNLRVKNNMKPVGYLVNWRLVLLAFGEGDYSVEFTIGQRVVEYPSVCLKQYHILDADETVRIEWVTNSIIGDKDQRLTRDFVGLNWYNQIRLCDSIFGKRRAPFEVESTRYNNGYERTIRKEFREEYTLTIRKLDIDKHPILLYDTLMGDDIIITDYNAGNNSGKYTSIEVEVNGSYEPNYSGNIPAPGLELTFVDKYSNRRKRYR